MAGARTDRRRLREGVVIIVAILTILQEAESASIWHGKAKDGATGYGDTDA